MPSGRDAASRASPYFFLSYAHRPGLGPDDEQRRNLLVKRFRDDLARAVRELARSAQDAEADVAVAVDADDTETPAGDGWSDRVSQALGRCGTFVALYSDEYFSSEYCGREWAAFADRIKADDSRRDNRSEAIIPVLWQPVAEDALPQCAREVEMRRYELGATYGRYGMNYLLRHLPEHRREYEAVVSELARRITEIAEHAAPVRSERSAEHVTPADAFHRAEIPDARLPRMKILIAALTTSRLPRGADPEMYGPRPADWKPFLPDDDRPVAGLLRRFAESMGFHGSVEAFERNAELGGDAEPTAPTLLVIDAWAVQDPSLRRQLSDFDRRADSKPWIRPMVLWNRSNPASRLRAAELDTRLASALEHCRSRYRSAAPRVLDGLETLREFVTELPDLMHDVERRYFAELSKQPGSRLAQQAPPRPRFRGSGPALGPRGTPADTRAERRPGPDSSDPERPR